MKNDEVQKFPAPPPPFCSAAWATTRARPQQNRSKAVASRLCGSEPLKFQSLNQFRALRAIAPVFPVPPVQSLLSALAASLKEHGRSFNGPPSAHDRDRKSGRTTEPPPATKKSIRFFTQSRRRDSFPSREGSGASGGRIRVKKRWVL